MSEVALFSAGFLVFSVTTSATMWFGYQQFNRIYRRDVAADSSRVLVKDENNTEFLMAPGKAASAGYSPVVGNTTS